MRHWWLALPLVALPACEAPSDAETCARVEARLSAALLDAPTSCRVDADCHPAQTHCGGARALGVPPVPAIIRLSRQFDQLGCCGPAAPDSGVDAAAALPAVTCESVQGQGQALGEGEGEGEGEGAAVAPASSACRVVDQGACEDACVSDPGCTEAGLTTCNDDASGVRTCEAVTEGCFQLGETALCDAGQVCDGGLCQAAVTEDCVSSSPSAPGSLSPPSARSPSPSRSPPARASP